ncbi:MAG: lipopolysaccharide transport periplasmic protein LptA [Epsilonproteobacteria bacterium 4484_20]|nr:MAG: lipopolysaccharide transport periplasmic protein LptA [Epsilonproteobacteria bacterium 4484_20]
MNFIKVLLPFFLFLILHAEKVEVTSDSMKAEELKKEVHFIGNVTVKQAESWLHGDRVIVYFDENNETRMYEAIGKENTVSFEVKEKKGFYKGSAMNVKYYPVTSKYVLTGKAVIDDLLNKRHVNGDVIILDMITGNAMVKGSREKPVKFIFDMEKKK